MVDDNKYTLTPTQFGRFYRDGYIIVRGLFSADELAPIQEMVHSDPAVAQHLLLPTDAEGTPFEVLSYTNTSDSFLGVMPRHPRLVDTIEALLEKTCYHFHSKVVMKSARSGGIVHWHADFSTWNEMGAPQPDLITASVAITENNLENGCLQMLVGSHFMGNPTMTAKGSAVYSEDSFVQRALDTLELVNCVMEPGDVLFFHAQTLHASQAARIHDDSKRVLIHCTYHTEAAHQHVTHESHHYEPMRKVADSVLAERSYSSFADGIEFRQIQANGDFYGEPQRKTA